MQSDDERILPGTAGEKKKGLTGSIPRFISLFIRALRFERDFTDVTLAAARSRRPYGTRKVLLSAASFPT